MSNLSLTFTINDVLAAVRQHRDYNLVKNAHPAAMLFWAQEALDVCGVSYDDPADINAIVAFTIDTVANDIGTRCSDVYEELYGTFYYRSHMRAKIAA
jgi:hypothetical protein